MYSSNLQSLRYTDHILLCSAEVDSEVRLVLEIIVLKAEICLTLLIVDLEEKEAIIRRTTTEVCIARVNRFYEHVLICFAPFKNILVKLPTCVTNEKLR